MTEKKKQALKALGDYYVSYCKRNNNGPHASEQCNIALGLPNDLCYKKLSASVRYDEIKIWTKEVVNQLKMIINKLNFALVDYEEIIDEE